MTSPSGTPVSKRPHFGINCPPAIARRTDLSSSHKAVYGNMAARQSSGTHFTASYGDIAYDVGMDRRYVRRIIDDLVARGEAKRTRRGREETCVFSLRYLNNRRRFRVGGEDALAV